MNQYVVAEPQTETPRGKNQGNAMSEYVVARNHPAAADTNPGTPELPLQTISAAAARVRPGDTVIVHAGVYRERISPAQGGTADMPITFRAAVGEEVFLRGSDVLQADWQPLDPEHPVYRAALPAELFGTAAYNGVCDAAVYGDFNPFHWNFNRAVPARPHGAAVAQRRAKVENFERVIAADSSGTGRLDVQRKLDAARKELAQLTREDNPRYLTTLGQVFVDGRPLVEVEYRKDLLELPGTWMAGPEGKDLLVHFPASHRPVADRLVEISTRHTVFSPLQRHLGYITIRGFTIEHGANHWPTWGKQGWPQVGLINCRSGHHWVIEDNCVRGAKGLGIDCGSEGSSEHIENRDSFDPEADKDRVGYHRIRNNWIVDNGHCGIAGIRHHGTRIIGNIVERNNNTGYTSPWWEFAGMKFHFLFDGLIEGNLIRDNEAHGIWLDNQFRGTRVTRNVIINNLWSGINVELGRGPVTIDNNIIAYTRQGDGIYGHDVADVKIYHNLIYCNANNGLWFAWCTPRVEPEDGCWDIHAFNNIIAGNKNCAIGYPLPWTAAGNNRSDHNLIAGGGETLDEGSKNLPPQFQITNTSHCARAEHLCPGPELQTAENVARNVARRLTAAGIPTADQPNMELWQDDFRLPLKLWQAVLQQDRHSRVFAVNRDGLQSRLVSWHMNLGDVFRRVDCEPIAGVDRDFLGNPMPANPMPGPFQTLADGDNHIMLWPVRGIRCTWPHV